VTFNNQYDVAPQWHPDGASLVYSCVSAITAAPEVCTVRLGTGEVVQLTNDGHLKWEPAWSPDGRYVAFQRKDDVSEGDDWEIVVINADGTGLVKLTDNLGWDIHPAWQRVPATAADELDALASAVDTLVSDGILHHGVATALDEKLDAADALLVQGYERAAANTLRAFINQLDALVRSRRLSPSLAQILIDAAKAAISRIEP
jgi:dipeptidyl aminopeptidase/acylaminoacyl peptidase